MLDNEEHKYWSYVEKHHVFNGPDRKHSEEDGLTVYLCVGHHRTGKAAVHLNRESDLVLKRYAQEIYEQWRADAQIVQNEEIMDSVIVKDVLKELL